MSLILAHQLEYGGQPTKTKPRVYRGFVEREREREKKASLEIVRSSSRLERHLKDRETEL